MNVTKWKKQMWKGCSYILSTVWGSGKAELWILGLGGSGQEDEYTEHRWVLGQWKYSWLNYNMTYTL